MSARLSPASARVASDRDFASAIVVGAIVGAIAFAAYSRTLLRTVDLGDSGGFQAAVTSPDISARQAYPLYHAIARQFVHAVAPENPALGLNLLSAATGGVAVGVLGTVSVLVTASPAAGGVASLLLASSYTWWHQANIAEVYTLHVLLIGLCLLALWSYAERQTSWRLAIFFLVYAAAFGNHLSMILLVVPFALFLLLVTTPRIRLMTPPVIGMAAAVAAMGALQYLPNLLALRNAVGAPRGMWATLAAFWFDVTKSDWRATMLLGVRESELVDHAAMALFDARQQFGLPGLALAIVGAIRLWRERRSWAVLCFSAYAINTIFAVTYNVGDPHVFFLPSHYFTAFCAGAAFLTPLRSPVVSTIPTHLRGRGGQGWGHGMAALSVVAIAYAGWRAYDTWPAVDRSGDNRAETIVEQLTRGIDEQSAVLAVDVDWQIENALLYSTRVDRRNVAWIRIQDVLPHFPFFVDANHAAGRDVVLSAHAAAEIEASFGPLFTLAPTDAPLTLAGAIELIPPGATYVLAVLAPPRGHVIDTATLKRVLGALTGNVVSGLQGSIYEVVVGQAGSPPALLRASQRPFRVTARIGGARVEVRMDGWLPTETFRRGGFGHIIRGRAHAMALERGVNLMWFEANGQPSRPYYASGLYEPQSRFKIPANAHGLALLR